MRDTRHSVNYAKDWLDQLFLFPGLVRKRVSPMMCPALDMGGKGEGKLSQIDKDTNVK